MDFQRTFNFEELEEKEGVVREAATTSDISRYRTGELLSDLLGTLPSDCLPLAFGERIEREVTFERLPELTLSELLELHPQFRPEEHRALLAAVELGRRVAEAKCRPARKTKITSSSDAISFCESHFARLIQDGQQEEFHILSLDTKNQIIRPHLITIGTLDASLVHPREVFRPAIRDAASSIIAVHNHPSGDSTPSPQDFSVTERLEQCGKTLGIDVLDHVVLGKDGSKSIRECR